MKNMVLLGMAAIPSIGIFSQWIAAKLKIPAILLLLLSGFLVGPIFKLINADLIFGDSLYPMVSLSVAIILFEGGLNLKFADIQHTGKLMLKMIFIGGIVTWIGISSAAYFLLGLDIKLCLLLGAVLSVSGPTVVAPLLRQIRLKKKLSSLLLWESIVIDPFGATLAVLVFEVVLAQNASVALSVAALIILYTIITGFVLGFIFSGAIILSIKKQYIPEYLQESFTLVMVLMAFALSSVLQSESGLLTVTLMGIILTNQKYVQIRHIISFKENITILLLSSLFIMLASRMHLNELLSMFDLGAALFIFSLIFIVRPLSVFISSMKQPVDLKEKLLLSFIYPRGIVAAVVSSLFAIRLADAGIKHAQYIVLYTFLTIIFTVIFYALLARPLVKLLNQGHSHID
jgi:NhaP-type Na+/H+ or K+/H+ antiporter